MQQVPVAAENLSPSDPFKALGIERSHKIDDAILEKALITASMRWHPDRWMSKSKEEQRQAEHNMASINTSFAALQDRLHRAEALLQHYGQALPKGTDKDSSPAMLIEMMELKEEAELVKSNKEKTQLFCNKLLQMENLALDETDGLFDEITNRGANKLDTKTIHTLRIKLNRAFYLRRTREHTDQAALK